MTLVIVSVIFLREYNGWKGRGLVLDAPLPFSRALLCPFYLVLHPAVFQPALLFVGQY